MSEESDLKKAVNKLVELAGKTFDVNESEELKNVVREFDHRTNEIPGETKVGFDEIIFGFPTHPNTGSFCGNEADARKVLCTAAILSHVAESTGFTSERKEPHRLGWSNFTTNAKGWCKRVLEIKIPREATYDILFCICEAKRLVGTSLDLDPFQERESTNVVPDLPENFDE
jgi:hypothetical protein